MRYNVCIMFLTVAPIFAVFFFALGAIVASFLGVVVERYGTGESWVTGHSKCSSCGATLTVIDLIPIISWSVLRGHCRTCGSRVPVSSTLAELTLGTLFVLAYLQLDISLSFVLLLVAFIFLTAVVLYDIRHTVIPGLFSLLFVLSSIAFRLVSTPHAYEFGAIFLVASGIALSFALMHYASRGRAMGLADTPISFGLALIAGSMAFSGLVYSFWVGAIIGIIILVRTPRGHRIGIEVPFAPFLAAGFLLAFFTGWNLFSILIL